MENECSSKGSIASSSVQFIAFSLRNQPQLLKHLERLLLDESCLELAPLGEADPHLAMGHADAMVQLSLQLRRVERSRWQGCMQPEQRTQMEERIKNILLRMRKLKEINIYFNDLQKQSGDLQGDVEKFMAYKPRDTDLAAKIQSFLSEPTVSELLLKQHERSINPNNFLADIIQFFCFLQGSGLVSYQPQQQPERVRNRDLVLIQNSKIIFRQVCQISDKYSNVEQQLEGAYVHLRFLRNPHSQDLAPERKYRTEGETVHGKMKQIAAIARKVRGRPAFSFEDTLVLPEEPDLFEELNSEFNFPLPQRNEHFFNFLEELYGGKPYEAAGVGSGNFQFIREKIVRTQMRWHLNRLFSALNVGSHIVAQLHDNISPQPCHYSFSSPHEVIKYQLNAQRASFYRERAAEGLQLQLLTRNISVLIREQGFVLRIDHSKVVYPSALHGYYYLLKYLLTLSALLQVRGVFSEQLLLQIISVKADEMVQWAETALTIYDMVKGKYPSCYRTFRRYITLAMRQRWAQELEWVERELGDGGEGKLLAHFAGRERKAGWINQIIFQLDSAYDLAEPLQRLLEVEVRYSRTGHSADNPQLYELILNEIIETRNNLKFERCYSFSTLHQLFALAGAHPASLRQLAQQLAPLSRLRLRLPQLLRLTASQSRLKRQIFRAQLYWTNIAQPSVRTKFIIASQRKKATFRDFLEENAKYLLGIADQTLEYFIANLEEVERAVVLFGQEVDRLKLIQSSLMLLKPDFPLEDHLAGFSHKQLAGFFSYCSEFNFVEDVYIRREKRNWVLGHIRRLLADSKLRFSDLNMELPSVALKQFLGGLIFLAYAFEQHLTRQDCMRLKGRVVDGGEPPEYHLKLEVLRSKRDVVKEYEDSQFVEGAALAELVEIYQLLMHIGLSRTVRREDVPHCDRLLLASIRQTLPSYEPYLVLQRLAGLETIKRLTGNASKAHTLTALRAVLTDYRSRRDCSKSYAQPFATIEHIFTVPEIGIVTRRIFCNQLIALKNAVSGQEWKNFNKQSCLGKLREIVDADFVEEVNCFLLQQCGISDLLNQRYSLQQNAALLADYARAEIIRQYDERFSFEEVDKRTIVLFDEERGIQVDFREEVEEPNHKPFVKKGRANPKRGLLNTPTAEDAHTANVVAALEQRVKLQIVKESLSMRKTIYLLQLQQKKIKDEIAWQTCKLEHNVINKINRFIEESNLDQKQSLINFKYTVNLETIKGIENVIHERTEIFGKKAEQARRQADRNRDEQARFVTQPSQTQKHQKQHQQIKHSEDQQTGKIQQTEAPRQPPSRPQQSEQSLLQINVKNIFNHVRQLKVFWGWKKLYLSRQSGEDEWQKFSINVERILHNRPNIARIQQLQQQRESCGKQQILCDLIRQQNALLNTAIRNTKINNLTHKLNQFKAAHTLTPPHQATP